MAEQKTGRTGDPSNRNNPEQLTHKNSSPLTKMVAPISEIT